MEQKTDKKAYLYTALILLAEMVAFGLLSLIGWFSAIAAYVTFFIFFVWKKYGVVPDKKKYAITIIVMSVINIISCLLAFVFSIMVSDKIGFASAFSSIFQNFGSYAIVFSISIALTVVFAVFGFLSAYQYTKSVSNDDIKEGKEDIGEEEVNQTEQQLEESSQE